MRECDKKLLAEHYLDFYYMAYALLGNPTDVEDAVQEALARTMARSRVEDPLSYCFTVLRNLCYRMLRSEYVLVNHFPEKMDYPGETHAQLLADVRELRERLSPRIREVFKLYYDEGLSQQEISEQMDIPMPTLKKLIKKGHSRLRKQLQNQ